MDEAERLKRGAAARRRVLGDAYVDQSDKSRNAFNGEWRGHHHPRARGCDVWTRPHFDDRTRRILVMGTLLAPRPLGRVCSSCTCAPR